HNEGGCGIRIFPRDVMAKVGYRPADEDGARACDTSILTNLKMADAVRVVHRDLDPMQIVDWKSPHDQLNPYDYVAAHHRSELVRDPFQVLSGRYPDDALDEMAAHYARSAVAAGWFTAGTWLRAAWPTGATSLAKSSSDRWT